MRRKRIIYLIPLLISIFSNAQDITFPIHGIENVKYAHPIEKSEDYQKYPYADVTVIVRNADKLNSSGFVQSNFKSLKYFYGELNLSGTNVPSQKIPLFLFQKNNNKFNTASIEDKTIITKYLYKPDGTNTLNGSINTTITIKDKLLVFLSNLSKVVKPLINSPASLLSRDAAVKSYEFFDEVLAKAAEDRVMEAQVGFQIFSPNFKKIHSYKVYVIAPTTAYIPKDDLILTRTDRYFHLTYNGSPYETFPYIIVLQTLTNYNGQLGNIPSQWIIANTQNNLNENEIKIMDSTLTVNRTSLSNQQIYAELVVLEYLKMIHLLRRATSNIPKGEEKDKLLTESYSKILYFQELKESANGIESELYADERIGLQPKIKEMEEKLEEYKKLLTYTDDLKLLRSLYEQNSRLTNTQLGRLSDVVSKLSTISYLKQNIFLLNAREKLLDTETELVRSFFKQPCDDLSKAEEVTTVYTNIKNQIQNLSFEYSNCVSCIELSKQAIEKYNVLVSGSESRKLIVAMRDTIFLAGDIMRLYKSKMDTYISLPDSIKQSLNVSQELNSLQIAINEIERKIQEINSISKTSFQAKERREVYDQLGDLMLLIRRLESSHKSTIERLKDIASI